MEGAVKAARTRSTPLALTVAWLAASPANAVLVPVDVHAKGDQLATLDTETGLEWLDLDQTVEVSFGDIAAGYGGWAAAGWRPATSSEVCGVIESYVTPILDPCPQDYVLMFEPTPELDTFIGLLGPAPYYERVERGDESIELKGAIGRYTLESGDIGHGGVGDANLTWGYFNTQNGEAMVLASDSGGPDARDYEYGLFLVRSVPEPSATSMTIVGCAGLAALARKGRRT